MVAAPGAGQLSPDGKPGGHQSSGSSTLSPAGLSHSTQLLSWHVSSSQKHGEMHLRRGRTGWRQPGSAAVLVPWLQSLWAPGSGTDRSLLAWEVAGDKAMGRGSGPPTLSHQAIPGGSWGRSAGAGLCPMAPTPACPCTCCSQPLSPAAGQGQGSLSHSPARLSSPSAVTQAELGAGGSGIPGALWLVPVHPSMEEAVCLRRFEGSSSFGCREVRLCLGVASIPAGGGQ